jgi:hypothetical protein
MSDISAASWQIMQHQCNMLCANSSPECPIVTLGGFPEISRDLQQEGAS